jgi:hypothetical protein
MESPFFESSPLVRSAKRGRPEELAQSPTAKLARRAKRVKSGKKRRDEGVNDSAISAGQSDLGYFDASPATQKDLGDNEMYDATAQNSPKTEANTRKARSEADHKRKHKHPRLKLNLNGNEWIPAVAGPSRPRAEHEELAEQTSRELTPLSDTAPPVDYTFKSFPNPTTSDYAPASVLEKPKAKV